jgi:hypothetical protein
MKGNICIYYITAGNCDINCARDGIIHGKANFQVRAHDLIDTCIGAYVVYIYPAAG